MADLLPLELIAFCMIAAAAGVFVGIFTGILPGLHINLISVIAASIFNSQRNVIDPLAVAVFILAMSISHVFHEFIPSVFLGVSESEAALAVLPGHRMLLRGQGRKAVMLASFGGLIGVLALVLLSPLLIGLIKTAYFATKSYVWLILTGIIAVHFLKIRGNRKIEAAAINALVLALSGLFGIAVFSLPNLKEPLLPMFSGLFGLSSLIGGLLNSSSFPQQQRTALIKIKKPMQVAKLTAVGIFSSSLMGLFPALGPAQAAMLGTTAVRKLKASAYMFLLGVITSASMLFAVLTLYAFGKARNGSIAVMGNILPTGLTSTYFLLAVAVIAAAVSFISANALSKLFLLFIKKINYALLNWAVIAFIVAFVAILSGPIGILVLIVAAATGLVPVLTKSSRQLLMGCLMVPVISYYL